MLAIRRLMQTGGIILCTLLIATVLGACRSTSSPAAAAVAESPSVPTSFPSPTSPPPTAVPSPTAVPPTATVVPTSIPSPTATPAVKTVDFSKVHPDELGEIPILEYHLIINEDDRWARSWEHFQGDLERLYKLGYRTVPLHDVIDDRIDVPAGYSPVVLTFDDSSPGQFTFIKQGGKLVPDPHSAVGILDAFYQKHPDFGEHATFFVLPAADPPHNLFGQDEYQKQKLEYLVAHGMEIGNHTYWHQNLSTVGDAEVQRQLGQAVQVIDSMVPGYDVDLFSLPEGAWPKHRELAIQGTWKGTTYHNHAVVLVGAQPALSPDREGFDPLALPRIQAIPQQLDLWLNALDHSAHQRYISDGDPDQLTFPTSAANTLVPKDGEKKLQSPNQNYEVVRLR